MPHLDFDYLIEARALERTYVTGGEPVHALRGVDLQVRAGEYVSLMGPSGSGKTTLFNLFGALDFPTAGKLQVGGRDFGRLRASELAYLRCANLGYIFQTYNLVEVLGALENVMLPMRFLGLSESDAAAKATALLERVGLKNRLKHRPAELSGGQQQRVAIARALANDPALILADEPTANLDSHASLEVVELLAGLCRERGVTVVSATHDPRMVAVSDRVVHLRDGRVEHIARRADLAIEPGGITAS